MILRTVALLALASLLGGCSGLTPVTIKGQTYQVELALDDEQRTRGLMFRTEMDADHGMLFVFPNEDRRAFWMKNTKIPLDIMYFNADRRFVSAQYNVPTCSAGDRCPNYPSDGAAKYVLELNAGVGKALSLSPGDELGMPDGIRPRD